MLDLTKVRKINKSNELVEARYKLSTVEQKIVLLLISEIDFEDGDLDYYVIPINTLLKALGMNTGGTDYRFLCDVIDSLMGRVLHIPLDGESWYKTHWVSAAKYDAKTKEVHFRLDRELHPYLLQLKGTFTSYDRRLIWRLKKSYSIRLYEILAKYRRLKQFRMDVDKLRDILGLDKGKYEQYGHLKARVLMSAQKELDEKTDLTFTFKEIKSGRKVVTLEFSIIQKELPDQLLIESGIGERADQKKAVETAELFQETKTSDPELVTELIKFGLSRKDALEIWDKKWEYVNVDVRQTIEPETAFETYIREKIFVVENAQKRGKVTKSVSGFLIAAIRKNYISTEFIEKEKKRIKLENERKIDLLERQKAKLIEQRDLEIATVTETIINRDLELIDRIVELLFKDGKSGIQTYYKVNKTALDNYQSSKILQGIVDREIKKMYPAEYNPVMEKYSDQIEEINQQIS